MALNFPVMEVAAAEASDDSSLVHDVTVGVDDDTILGAAVHLAALVLSLPAGEEYHRTLRLIAWCLIFLLWQTLFVYLDIYFIQGCLGVVFVVF